MAGMRAAYRGLASLIALGVVVQVAAIAFAGFTLNKDAENGVTVDTSYSNLGQSIHQWGGTVIGLLALVFLIVSFLTGVPGGRKLAGLVIGLVVLQMALAVLASGVPALGVLHGINGLAIAAVAGTASRRASTPVPAQSQAANA